MSHLRVVDQTFVANDRHSIRASDLTVEQIGDLHLIAANVLAPTMVAARELGDAIRTSNPTLAITAMRRLVAASQLARQYANTLERDPEWQTPS